MQRNIVLTLTGPDRVGIVEQLTGLLLERGANVETSRMVRLGGEFAVLMLLSVPTEQSQGLEVVLQPLTTRGYKSTITQAERPRAEAHLGWVPYLIELQGADHEGIIHQVAHYLSGHGINIESAESECSPGATSGVPLFSMVAEVVVPPQLDEALWFDGLRRLGARLNLDIHARRAQP